jgi:DNA-binding winged helix-turn-helix (wHTH) protein/tetratricopeptide (TPR) repeat protein
MIYRWDDFVLDRRGMSLTRNGQRVDASRRVLQCIGHLLDHHARVVGYDELILAIWEHDNVSNHQLSQVILSARRTLGDDGQTQRCIRTLSGLGYRWVAPLEEDAPPARTDAGATPIVAAGVAATAADKSITAEAATEGVTDDAIDDVHPQGPTAAPPAASVGTRPASGRRLRIGLSALIIVTTAAAALAFMRTRGPTPPNPAPDAIIGADRTAVSGDPIEALRQALFMGRFETVREGLALLPAELADSKDARLIEIELDIRRGRFTRAEEKLAIQTSLAQAADDRIWRARLLSLQSEINNRRQLSGAEVLAPAEAAVELLESAGTPVPPQILAEALRQRSNGLNLSDRLDEAQRDLVRARDLYGSIGDAHRSAEIRGSLARVRMREGRLSEALDEMRAVAAEFQRFDDSIREIFARNTMTKIQVELLRWDDALQSNDRSMQLLRSVPHSERRYPTLQLRALVLTGQGRLREAASLLEEAEALASERRDFIIPAIHHLEAGNPQAALDAAIREFESTRIDNRSNLILENKDGALLLWVMAAEAHAAQGLTTPRPSQEQAARLQQPQTPTARAARGRWLLLQGRTGEAEAELQRALREFDAQNQLYRMILAAEPLMTSRLERGDLDSARALVTALRARDPERIDRDYRAALLQLQMATATSDHGAIATSYSNVMAARGERTPPQALVEQYRNRSGGN